jgi:Myb-like DNA-binding domain
VPRSQDDYPNIKAPDRSLVPQLDCPRESVLVGVSNEVATSPTGNGLAGLAGDSASRSPDARISQSVSTSAGVGVLTPAANISQTGRPHRPKGVPLDVASRPRSSSSPRLATGLAEITNQNAIVGSVRQNAFPPCDADREFRSAKVTSAKSASIPAPLSTTLQASRSASSPSLISSPQGMATGTLAVLVSRPVNDILMDKVVQLEKTAPPQSASVIAPVRQGTIAISATESQTRQPNETANELSKSPRDRHVSGMSPDKSALTTQICGRSDISSSVRGADPKTSPRAIASPVQPSYPLPRVPLSRPHPASPATRLSPVDSIASILRRIANVDASIKRVDGQIFELREKELLQQDVPSTPQSKMNRSEPASGAITEMSDGDSSDASSQARALLKRLEERHEGDVYSRKLLSPFNQSILYILEQNRCRAASASGALRRLCSKPEFGLDPAFVDEAPNPSPVSADVAEQVRQVLIDRRNMREVKKRELTSEYLKHVGVWKVKTKQARDKRSRDKREICRERDRFLYRSIMGENVFLQARTSSGRTTTKVISGINSSGPVNYTAEIDASLAEIELQGGTPGSKEIWSRTLAPIPEQRADVIPSDYGSILIEDPVREVHNRRAVNPWTREETFVFLDKYVLYPKNFKRIASFLEHKSFGDVVEFYYRNKLHLKLKFLAAKRKTIKRAYLLSLAGLRRAPESLKQRSGSAARSDDLKSPTLENRTVDPKVVSRQSCSPQVSEIGAATDERMRSPPPSSARNGRLTEFSSCHGNDPNSSPIVGRATRAQVRDAETRERGISFDGLVHHAKAKELCVDAGIQDSERGHGKTKNIAKQLKPVAAIFSPDQVHSNTVDIENNYFEGCKLGKAEPHGAIEPEELETEPDISPEGKEELAAEITLRRASKQKMVIASTPVSPTIVIKLCQSDSSLDKAGKPVKRAPESSLLSAEMNRVGMSIGEVATRECPEAHASQSQAQVASSEQNDGVHRVEDLGCPERSVAVADECTERSGSQTAAISGEKGSRKLKTALWSSQEVCFFEKLFETYGKDWKKISAIMTSKSPTQVKGYWRRRGSDPKELSGFHDAPLGTETVTKQSVVVSRESDKGSDLPIFTSEGSGEPAQEALRTTFVLPVAATHSLSGASVEGSKSLSEGAPVAIVPQCSKGMSDESTDGGAQLTPSQRSRTVSQVMEPLQTETSSARVKTGTVAASKEASYVESSKAARRDDAGLESATFSRIGDIAGRKRDAEAADLQDLGGNGSKRDRSFSGAAAVQIVRASEIAESPLASRAVDGIGESSRAVVPPVAPPGLLRSRPQQDVSKASSMSLNFGIISKPACPISSPNIAPEVMKFQAPSAPVAARSATIKLPKFRSMPLPPASDAMPVGVPRSAPVPPSSRGKPGGAGPARPALVAVRVPPNQPLTPHSISPAGVSNGGLATPRSSGSSRLQELVNKARAAGFITKGS